MKIYYEDGRQETRPFPDKDYYEEFCKIIGCRLLETNTQFSQEGTVFCDEEGKLSKGWFKRGPKKNPHIPQLVGTLIVVPDSELPTLSTFMEAHWAKANKMFGTNVKVVGIK